MKSQKNDSLVTVLFYLHIQPSSNVARLSILLPCEDMPGRFQVHVTAAAAPMRGA